MHNYTINIADLPEKTFTEVDVKKTRAITLSLSVFFHHFLWHFISLHSLAIVSEDTTFYKYWHTQNIGRFFYSIYPVMYHSPLKVTAVIEHKFTGWLLYQSYKFVQRYKWQFRLFWAFWNSFPSWNSERPITSYRINTARANAAAHLTGNTPSAMYRKQMGTKLLWIWSLDRYSCKTQCITTDLYETLTCTSKIFFKMVTFAVLIQ